MITVACLTIFDSSYMARIMPGNWNSAAFTVTAAVKSCPTRRLWPPYPGAAEATRLGLAVCVWRARKPKGDDVFAPVCMCRVFSGNGFSLRRGCDHGPRSTGAIRDATRHRPRSSELLCLLGCRDHTATDRVGSIPVLMHVSSQHRESATCVAVSCPACGTPSWPGLS